MLSYEPLFLMECLSQGHQALLVEQTMCTVGRLVVVFLSVLEEDLS